MHAHTFRFITPATTQTLNVPNPCTLCHTDKTVEWADKTSQCLDGTFALAHGKLGGVCNGTRRVEGGEGRAKR